MLFKTGFLRLLLNLVPEDQPLVRVMLSLFLVFVGIGLGGAVNGFLRGHTLHLIDPGGSRRRYLLGGAFDYGISQGMLIIPMLLLIAIIGKYNSGSTKDPASFLILFSLLGGIYGLVSGLILALITLRLRYIWRAWLASIVGYGLGGLNRIGLKLLNEELSRRGLSEYVELRFFDGRVHAKSALMDDQLLFVGSQNFHYSSFGPSGLLEFGVATDSPEAIQAYQEMFEYYWSRAIPSDEAVWGTVP